MDALPLHAPRPYRRSESDDLVTLKLSYHVKLPRTANSYSTIVCALSNSSNPRDGRQRHHTPPAPSSALHEHREERKKSFRLKARCRLALRHLRRLSPSFIVQNLLVYVRVHAKTVALSILLGCTLAMGCLCLKLTSTPTPRIVPYSELVNHLQTGSVVSVLFEEGSRQVYFDLKPVEGGYGSAQSNVRENLAAANLDYLQGNYEKSVVDAQMDKAAVALNEAALKQSQMELSALRAVMDEDILKHWAEQAGTTGSRTLLPGIMERGKDEDTSSGDGSSSTSSSVTDTTFFPSSAKSIEHPPEQSLKTQSNPWRYATRRIENDEAFLLGLLREKAVTYSSSPQTMSAVLRTTLITVLSLWIPLTPLFWLMYRQFLGGNTSNLKRRSRSPITKFDDVAGVDEAKAELIEIVSYLQGALNFRTLGAKLPKGILLVGPPGTGKTLLARAVAGEAGVPFFATSASEFVEMFVGRGAARIRSLFMNARKQSPSIIFIDELDAVGGRRGRSFNDERDQTLNQLLTEMDGFEAETGVLVIAATNRPEALDPALCRAGRFSRKVFVREPDQRGREQILAVHMRGVPIEGDLEFVTSVLASITGGFVGADLANVVNEAALLAVREGRPKVELEDLKAAVLRVKFGVGNRPAMYGALGRVAELFKPKSPKSPPPGYEAPSWSG